MYYVIINIARVCVYQGALPFSRLRYLNKAVSSQIYKKCNWQRASAELATWTARHYAGLGENNTVFIYLFK